MRFTCRAIFDANSNSEMYFINGMSGLLFRVRTFQPGPSGRIFPCVHRDDGRKFHVSGFHFESEASIGGGSFGSGGGGDSCVGVCPKPDKDLLTDSTLRRFLNTLSRPFLIREGVVGVVIVFGWEGV